MTRGNINIPDRLKPFIRAIGYIDGGAANSVQYYADGTPGIVFQQKDTGVFACSKSGKIPDSYVFGQTINPIVLQAPKDCILISVALYPHVLQSIFRFNASEITDGFVDLQDLPGKPHTEAIAQLWETNDPQQQLRLIFRYLEALIERNSAAPDKGIQYAVNRIWQGKERGAFKNLHRELNVSERTFERKFEQQVGLSPRLLANITQFQASLSQLKTGKYQRLSDIAYENGYSDQSHFIRAFKRFTGVSPLQFTKGAANDSGMAESFYF
jgi:AraC-like DNA-binding protein